MILDASELRPSLDALVVAARDGRLCALEHPARRLAGGARSRDASGR